MASGIVPNPVARRCWLTESPPSVPDERQCGALAERSPLRSGLLFGPIATGMVRCQLPDGHDGAHVGDVRRSLLWRRGEWCGWRW